MPNAEYDAIATDYQASKQLPFRVYAEQPLLVSLLGDVSGLDILDLACGEGIYARRLKAMGASTVVGIDLSAEMIALAKEREKQQALGIQYQVGNAGSLGQVGTFDIVLCSYLLNYARTEDELIAFCKTIVANLKPGGRLIGLNDNSASDPACYPLYRKYGFIKSTPMPRKEGNAITYTFFNEDGTSFHFDNFYLAPETYTRAFQAAGLSELCWHTPKVTEAGIKAMGLEYWREFQADAPVLGLTAKRLT